MLPSITLYQEFLETWPLPNIKRGWTIVQLGLNFVFILTLLFVLDGFEITDSLFGLFDIREHPKKLIE